MFARLITAALTALAVASGAAHAENTLKQSVNYKHEYAFTPVFGQTPPPVGYVNFCARNTEECQLVRPAYANSTILLTPQRWAELNEVNSYVNAEVEPVSDIDLYDVPEHWGYPRGAGDCEDYVLLKKRYLEGLGFPAEALLITVVLDETGAGHAVLTAKTDAGDFILDNRRDAIHRWSETRYQFLKRQSQQDPQVWVALTNKQGRSTSFISGVN